MRKPLLMAVVGIMLALGFGIARIVFDLSVLGENPNILYHAMTGFSGPCEEVSPAWHRTFTFDPVVTTKESAVISFRLNGAPNQVCNHVFVLSGGSSALTVTPTNEQTITLNPNETKVVSWTLSTPNPSVETMDINPGLTGIKVVIKVKFILPYLGGLTIAQIRWVLLSGVVAGVALIVPWLWAMLRVPDETL